jgi:hypothetical protein
MEMIIKVNCLFLVFVLYLFPIPWTGCRRVSFRVDGLL